MVSDEASDHRLHRLGVEPLHAPQQRVQHLAPAQPGVEPGLSLLHLPDDHVHRVGEELQSRVLNQQQAGIGALGCGGVDVAGKAQPHDVHVGDRLEAAVGGPALDAELAEGQVAAQTQVGLHQADADVHGRQCGRTKRAAGCGRNRRAPGTRRRRPVA